MLGEITGSHIFIRGGFSVVVAGGAALQGCEQLPARGVIDRPPVVGIDEVQIPQLRALVEIRNARRGDLDEQLREAVVDAGFGDTRLERLERLQKCVRPAAVEDRAHERFDALLVFLVRAEPARVHLRFAQRLRHVGGDAIGEARPRAIVCFKRPRADERLVDQVLVV